MMDTQNMWPGELDGYFRLITSLDFGCVGGIKRIPKILGNTTFMARLIYSIDRQTENSTAGISEENQSPSGRIGVSCGCLMVAEVSQQEPAARFQFPGKNSH